MDSATDGTVPPRWMAALGGLQAGVLGAGLSLLWLGVNSAWQRRSFWAAANLMASTFYGDDSIHTGFARSTVTGIAFYIVLYGLLGALFAYGISGRIRGLRLFLAGVVFGAAWYYFSFGLLWKNVSPLLVLLHPQRPTLVGHILFGGIVGRFERFTPGASH